MHVHQMRSRGLNFKILIFTAGQSDFLTVQKCAIVLNSLTLETPQICPSAGINMTRLKVKAMAKNKRHIHNLCSLSLDKFYLKQKRIKFWHAQTEILTEATANNIRLETVPVCYWLYSDPVAVAFFKWGGRSSRASVPMQPDHVTLAAPIASLVVADPAAGAAPRRTRCPLAPTSPRLPGAGLDVARPLGPRYPSGGVAVAAIAVPVSTRQADFLKKSDWILCTKYHRIYLTIF